MANADNTSLPNEEWRPVVGYEGLYEVSDHGRVRSVDRMIPHNGETGLRKLRGRILKPAARPDGYLKVGLFKGGTERTKRVHNLVAEAFLGPQKSDMAVCHADGTKTNNHVSNLRYGSKGDNEKDKVKHGTHQQARKTHCPQGHRHCDKNNVAWQTARGRRACLACSKARSYVHYHQELKPHFKQIADSYYEDIMK